MGIVRNEFAVQDRTPHPGALCAYLPCYEPHRPLHRRLCSTRTNPQRTQILVGTVSVVRRRRNESRIRPQPNEGVLRNGVEPFAEPGSTTDRDLSSDRLDVSFRSHRSLRCQKRGTLVPCVGLPRQVFFGIQDRQIHVILTSQELHRFLRFDRRRRWESIRPSFVEQR